MVVTACPAAEIAGPPETIWALLSSPQAFETWVDARLVGAEPAGPIQPGQHLRFVTRGLGRTFAVSMDVGEVDPGRRVRLLVRLPFGIVNDETISLSPTAGGGTLCRFG